MNGPLRIAMLGTIPGNGHPYSWSAIINGYDAGEMAKCPYPIIAEYLGAQPFGRVGIPDARVTHIWTDEPSDAPLVAASAKIPHVVERPEDVIGKVDAVIIPTDDSDGHVNRARPFIEAALPVFVDKPLAVTRETLSAFVAWKKAGARIFSSSGMRYAPELAELEGKKWLWLTSATCRSLERYGIHALEPVFKLLGPGFEEVRTEHQEDSDIVYCRHRSGILVTLAAIRDANACFGVIHAYGEKEQCAVRMQNYYDTFRNQLLDVINWFRTGKEPYPFAHTIEMMAILIAAQESRDRDGAKVAVQPILEKFAL